MGWAMATPKYFGTNSPKSLRHTDLQSPLRVWMCSQPPPPVCLHVGQETDEALCS